MADSFHSAELREWAPGYYETVLPEDLSHLTSPENRASRVTRCSGHIMAGAHRNICRSLVYTEDEFRSAVRVAGREPGHGWMSQPRPANAVPQPQPAPETPRQPPEPSRIAQLFPDEWDDIPL
jgi:hypothetical protein